ncbi:hypothetical protein [Isoptericola sp. NPDC056134]|uniref:hypothetical protein n=1 Tax=Isoptericola sp. NPDC056134 TaxID=3345723 RepID=UPI0035E9A0EB
MTHDIPSRPPYTRDEAEAFRSAHRHTAERQDDGKVVELVHNGTGHQYHGLGRAVYMLSPEEEAAAEQNARKASAHDAELFYSPRAAGHFPHVHQAVGDETPVEDMGERPDVAGLAALRAAAPLLDKAGIPSAMVEGLAVAHEQDAALDELGSLGGSVTAFDKGESSGIELGRLQAIKVIERHKAALKDDPDEYAVSILDDIVLDLMNRATS